MPRIAIVLLTALASGPGVAATNGVVGGIVSLQDFVVTASHSVNQNAPVQNVTLDKKQVEALPHFGNDLYRVLGVLPGVVANDQSAKFSVRGSLPREVLVEFDGVELYEPFHLRDFQGIFSIIDPGVVDTLDLNTGGFTAEFGNRSAGLLEISSINPTSTFHSVGLSLISTWLNSAGTFADGEGFWVLSVRRGYLDLLLDLVDTGEDEGEEGDTDPDPTYWDAYAKIGYAPNPLNIFTVNILTSGDSLKWKEREEDETIDLDTSYGNSYLWLRHEGQFGARAQADTILSLGRVDEERSIFLIDNGDRSEVDDDRTVNLMGLKQRWGLVLSERHYLKLGWSFDAFEADYDYRNSFDSGVAIPDDRFLPPRGAYEYKETHDGEQYGVYLADRFRLIDPLVIELGFRYDHLSLTDENNISPRFNAVYDLGHVGAFHLGFGHYYQTHRPHELDVPDRETEFYDAEKAVQTSLGYEKAFADNYRLRIDGYYRTIGNPRPRYENVFDPFNEENPETRPDRARLDIDESTAKGVEVMLGRQSGENVDWSLAYAWSSAEDDIDGASINRAIDQPHALTAVLTYRPSSRWDLTATWHYHTGWPRTEVTAVVDGSEIVPVVGEFYAKRHPDYHRLDLRLSYRTLLGNNILTYFIDIQNAYNRRNVRGFSLDEDSFALQPDGSVVVSLNEEKWLGILPSFGVKYEF